MLRAVQLDDRYSARTGRELLSGTQALVRLLIEQRRRDLAENLNTAGFVSGYRGSPLAGVDRELWRVKDLLERNDIRFQPGVNEDLAATAIWGTQQLNLIPGAKYDGVFALWYGKGPGVDRSGDAFKHANQAGTSRHGGVIVAFGDDHSAESSTLAHQSEQTLVASMLPILNPGTVEDILELGLVAWALSRYSGLWVGLKCTADVVGTVSSVDVGIAPAQFVTPSDVAQPPDGVHIRLGHAPLEAERRLLRHRLPMALAFARANGIDKAIVRSDRKRIGIVATGVGLIAVRDALRWLRLDDDRAAELGIGLYKVAMSWPLEPVGLRAFAAGYEELLCVEDKSPLIEDQAARILYDLAPDVRPRLLGKKDDVGAPLLPSDGSLTSRQVALAIAARLRCIGWGGDDADTRAQLARAAREDGALRSQPALSRPPYFCSGCPHNRSTVVPDGSQALAGIGCSYMAVWMDRDTLTSVHMGAEGANWNGIAPFTSTPHVFQNMGDGTYFHSGVLAIRAAVAAGVNITYKILYNDAVAMTGGQPVEGQLTVMQVARQVLGEGVKSVTIVTDDIARYRHLGVDAAEVNVCDRTELDPLQRQLRVTPGTTVLIYDQTCAAEKRRRRKRRELPDPARRLFINPAVCEGCGDCSVKSNCVSVLPLETPRGRKRRIDQSSCNKDYSCVEGFCPSFVTVLGGQRRFPQLPAEISLVLAQVPEPLRDAAVASENVLIAGVGGTGIVTLGALLAMAGHVENKRVSVFDMTGLAQKNGAVLSHVRIAPEAAELAGARLAAGEAGLILGCDLVTSVSEPVMQTVDALRTKVVFNTHLVPPGDFQRQADMDFHASAMREVLVNAVSSSNAHSIDATTLATSCLGDAAWANVLLLGYAYQLGLIPVSAAAIERAMEINGVAIEENKRAFAVGRLACHDFSILKSVATPWWSASDTPQTVEETVKQGASYLEEYQDHAYARRYCDFLAEVQVTEKLRTPGRDELTRAVAHGLLKLMAYKDEYEVARLLVDEQFRHQLNQEFVGQVTLRYHMAPPFLARRNPLTNEPLKREFGPWIVWVLRILARLKGLRGTYLDIFAHTAERRTERRLPEEYCSAIRALLADLDSTRHATAVCIARLPEQIRGFGHVKHQTLLRVIEEEQRLWTRLNGAGFRAPHGFARAIITPAAQQTVKVSVASERG